MADKLLKLFVKAVSALALVVASLVMAEFNVLKLLVTVEDSALTELDIAPSALTRACCSLYRIPVVSAVGSMPV